MILTRISLLSGRENQMELPITAGEYSEFMLGRLGLVQEAFPELSADQREFILSGATPEEWDSVMGEMGETDD